MRLYRALVAQPMLESCAKTAHKLARRYSLWCGRLGLWDSRVFVSQGLDIFSISFIKLCF